MKFSKISLLFILNAASFAVNSQEIAVPSQVLADEFKKLIELNSAAPNIVDLSGKEAVNLTTNASPRQIIEMTTSYLNSNILNAKTVCYRLLVVALFRKTTNQLQRQEIVEILCKNYLHNNEELQLAGYNLLRLKEKDYNTHSKKYIAALIDSIPRFDNGICAQLLAMAQIRKSIPALWKIANKNITTMRRSDLNVLASLARLGEKEAGILLCNYYNSIKNKTDYKHVFVSKELSFALDKTVFDCLVTDFRTIDIAIHFREHDSGYWPSQYLATHIAEMVKHYPYPKQDYDVDPKQLSGWLTETNQFELEEK